MKCGRQNGRQKQGFLSKNRIFDRIKLSNTQKNRAFIRAFLINTRFWCGRQELKTCDDMKKALIFKAFLLLNANAAAKKIHVKIKNGHAMYEFKVKMLGVWAKI